MALTRSSSVFGRALILPDFTSTRNMVGVDKTK